MSEKLNYLRFMSYKEFESYWNDEPIRCKKSWREGEAPKFYFFGVKQSNFHELNLFKDLDIKGYYWIESAMAYDLCHNVDELQYEVAIIFEGDGSLEAEEYVENQSLCPNEFKGENYNHLKILDIKYCCYEGGRGAEIELVPFYPLINLKIKQNREALMPIAMAEMP